MWPVAGGFHAHDASLSLTVYGKNEDAALARLEEARRRAYRLAAVALASLARPGADCK